MIDPDPGAEPAPTSAPVRRSRARTSRSSIPALRTAHTAAISEPGQRVLVTTGGADAAGIGARIASNLALEPRDADVGFVVGPWGAGTDHSTSTIVHAPDGLARRTGRRRIS